MLPAWGLYRWVSLRTLVTSPLQRLGLLRNRAADTVTVVRSLCFLDNWLCVALLLDPGVRGSATSHAVLHASCHPFCRPQEPNAYLGSESTCHTRQGAMHLGSLPGLSSQPITAQQTAGPAITPNVLCAYAL